MISTPVLLDTKLAQRLDSLEKKDHDFWSFKGNSKREHGHIFLQYPAMMVPQMVGTILDVVCDVHPSIQVIGDPFSGSGTTLTESINRGLSFIGRDINPLAVLLCKVKSGPFYFSALSKRVDNLYRRIESDKFCHIDIDFPGLDKWFKPETQIALSKIRRSIKADSQKWARRFFWIGMAEAVRLSSNSRTTTFKLHTRTKEDIEARQVDVLNIFKRAVDRNLIHLRSQAILLKDNKFIDHGRYRNDIKIILGDSKTPLTNKSSKIDLIVTSPPYGDNATTVPYGQYSYLPLQWIDMQDIDPQAHANLLSSTHAIDTKSLGGNKFTHSEVQIMLMQKSESFLKLISKLKNEPKDRTTRVTAFVRDLSECLAPTLNSLNPGGIMVWTLGNRKVGGYSVPLDNILEELLYNHKAVVLRKLSRKIFSKRMAPKNSVADTMSSETILVMRKVN